MKITVEHEIPHESGNEDKCLYDGNFWGNAVCPYHTHRDRTHGRKAPIERRLPKCTLFDEWLPGEYIKCESCWKAIEATKENSRPLTLDELREMAERCESIYITRIDDETPIFRGNKIVGGVLDKAAVMNVADHLPFMAIYGRNLTLAESDYGKTWLAYRTKPIGGIKP